MSERRVERGDPFARLAPASVVVAQARAPAELALPPVDRRSAATLVGTALLRPKTPLVLDEHRADGRWRGVSAPLFGRVVRATDLRAGALEDCYLVAALNAIAAVRPEWLPEIIADDLQTGDVVARFFDLDSGAPVRVAVPRSLPVRDRDGRPLYGTWQGGSWGAFTEKAYAAYYGGYESVGRLGVAAYALRELTGFTTRTYRPTTDGLEATFAAMSLASRERRPMVAETTARNFSGCGVARQGLVAGHSYAVSDVTTIDGVRWVSLQEPAGREEFKTSGYDSDVPAFAGARANRNDGVFRMRFDDFARAFPSVVVVTAEPLSRTRAAPQSTTPPTHLARAGGAALPGPLLCDLRP